MTPGHRSTVDPDAPGAECAIESIRRKRDGCVLAPQEIEALVRGYVQNTIPDYQMAALAMAICLKGMNADETAALTHAMLVSGSQLAWSDRMPPRVDKHSTGGLGDKTSLILAPLLASCGVAVPMISGRGLGITGGTLDKLESIPGYRTDLSIDQLQRQTESVGCAITGATADLAPADRKLYALRDVTATVESVPLITASILSKKLAEGLDALVLDVKAGSGAFMKTPGAARVLAESLVQVAHKLGVPARALITDMNQPLGRMVGCAVEVDEAVAALEGRGPADLVELTLSLGVELLLMAKVEPTEALARRRLQTALDSGVARQKFADMVAAQGGNLDTPLPVARATEIRAARAGYVRAVDGQSLGTALVRLGGGRRVMTDPVDHSVGLEMLVRIGDQVQPGQPLMKLFAPPHKAPQLLPMLQSACELSDQPVPAPPLIYQQIDRRSISPRRTPQTPPPRENS